MMNIVASGTIDKASTAALYRVSISGKGKFPWRNALLIVFTVVLLAVGVLLGALGGFDATVIWILSSCTFLLLLELYLYVIFPKIREKSMRPLLGCVNTYEFHDNDFSANSQGAGIQGTSTQGYAVLQKVFETDRYLFLFQINNTALIVEKATVSGHELHDLREKLRSVVPKYVRCDY